MIYKTSELEEERLEKFYKKHFDKCGGYHLVTFSSEGGIGHTITVKCPVCKKRKNII